MKTSGVIITYNPDLEFGNRLKAISRECKSVFIIDNGSQPESLKPLRAAAKKFKAKLIELGENTGIAHAQNVGLKAAFEKKADGVILFDHDSIPQKGFAAALWHCYEKLGRAAIVAPRVFDVNTKSFALHPVYRGMFFKRMPCPENGILPDAVMAIASGTLISRAVYQAVGGMRDELFIDYVDWEYCLRAAQKFGIATTIAGGAVLHHARGERKPQRFLGLTIYPPGYSTFRVRYLFSNRARLLREYLFRNRAFVFFELAALVRDFLLLPFETCGWSKFFLALRSWFGGFLAIRPKT